MRRAEPVTHAAPAMKGAASLATQSRAGSSEVVPKVICVARNLTYQVAERRLVDGIDLALPASTLTMLMGPNGAGKSLLLRLLHGLIEATEGDVTWFGEPMGLAVRKRQAMVFQKPVLLRRSVAANFDFVMKLRGRADRSVRDELLNDVGLLAHANQPARQLSGGEQQRLALARALALRPQVMFLDEPTASLDPASAVMIEDILRRVQRSGTKIVMVSHDPAQAKRLADEVVFMNRGKLVEHSGVGAFFTTPKSAAAAAYLDGKLIV